MNHKCLCGREAERFELIVDSEDGSRSIGAVVGGEICCDAFSGRRYQDVLDYEGMVTQFNNAPYVDLGIEAGVC